MLMNTVFNFPFIQCWLSLVKPECYINAFYSYHKHPAKRQMIDHTLSCYKGYLVHVGDSFKIVIGDEVFGIICNQYTNEIIFNRGNMYYHFDASCNQIVFDYLETLSISHQSYE